MTYLEILTICRIRELAQEAFIIHQSLMKWRETPLDSIEKTKESVKLQEKLGQLDGYARALLDHDWPVGYYPGSTKSEK